LSEAHRLGRWHDKPGSLSGSATAITVGGLLVTLLLMAMMLDLYGFHRHGARFSREQRLWCQAPTFALAALLWLRSRKQSELSTALRASLWIPILHAGMLACALLIWIDLTSQSPRIARHFPLLSSWTVGALAAIAGGALLVGLAIYGIATEGRKQPAFLHPLAIGLLVFTLLLGLWLPITPTFLVAFDLPDASEASLQFRDRFLWISLLVPASLALPTTLLASQVRLVKFCASYGCKLLGGSLLAVSMIVTIATRLGADAEELVAYANMLPYLVCAAMLSLLAVAAIGLTHWQALRSVRKGKHPAPWMQEGHVVLLADAEAPGTLHYRNWFLGLRTQCTGLILRSSAGDLRIPAGARLVARLPLWSSRATPGQSKTILQAGDRVRALGFVAPPVGNAFRHSHLPIPGSKGLVLLKLEPEEGQVWRDLALLLWRPVVLYLAVISLIALPGLAGFFAL
jgi:hypothetical protein